jgi:hypothetical protein
MTDVLVAFPVLVRRTNEFAVYENLVYVYANNDYSRENDNFEIERLYADCSEKAKQHQQYLNANKHGNETDDGNSGVYCNLGAVKPEAVLVARSDAR